MGFLKWATVAASLLTGSAAVGQQLSLGLIGGASLTQDFQNATFGYGSGPTLTVYSTPKRYVAGGMLEMALPLRFAVEVDGLFRELEYTSAAIESNGTLNSVSPSPVVTWEFPALAKYRFASPVLTPFLEAGPSFRISGNLNGTSPSKYGFTVGAGFEKQLWKIKIAPQIRYTRWAQDSGQGNAITKPDQLELLFGFSGRGDRSDWHPWGHSVSFGVVLGTNLTDDFRATSSTNSYNAVTPTGTTNVMINYVSHSGPQSFIAGPMIGVQLPHRLSIELDAIHRPLQSISKTTLFDSNGNTLVSYGSTNTVTTWQFPVVAKYKFSFPFAERFPKLFAEAGPSFRLAQQVNESFLSKYGVTAGLGVQTHVRALVIEPGVRYTHWSSDNPPGASQAFRNEAQLLVGFSF